MELPLNAPEILKVPSVTECAYFAGLIDGEGTITIHRAKDKRDNSYSTNPVVQLGMSNLEILLWVQPRFGGTLYQTKWKKPKPQWALSYRLHWNTAQIMALFETVKPYLIIKRKQLEIVTTWIEQTYSGKLGSNSHAALTPEKRELRENLRQAIRALNKKGLKPADDRAVSN